jgi:hypothetical protein
MPAFAFLLAGAAYQDKPDEAQPRPNNGVVIRPVTVLLFDP